MKVLCSACEAAEARVLCCADEAALCARCDRDVHAANRLAGKHHRLPLLPPADVSAPNCDICQEAHAYFFCVEDRALLCRACDVAVHTANAFVSAHRRFLLTGVQVGQEPDATAAADSDADPHPPTATAAAADPLQTPPPPDRKPPASGGGCGVGSPAPLYSDDDIDWAADAGVGLPDWALVHEQFGAPPVPRPADQALARTTHASKRSPRRSLAAAFNVQGGGGLAGGFHDWPLDEFFGFSEYSPAGLGFAENGTSKADSGKFGSTGGSPAGRSSSDASQDFFGEVPEFHQWSVPELPSPPTASGLHWQGGPRHDGATTTTTTDNDTAAVFVPDISSPENPFRCYATAVAGQQPPAKRRRRC